MLLRSIAAPAPTPAPAPAPAPPPPAPAAPALELELAEIKGLLAEYLKTPRSGGTRTPPGDRGRGGRAALLHACGGSAGWERGTRGGE